MPSLYDYNNGLNEDALRTALMRMRGNVQADSQDFQQDMGFQHALKQAMNRGQAGTPTSIADIQQEQAQQAAPMAEAPDPEMPIAGQGGGFMNVVDEAIPNGARVFNPMLEQRANGAIANAARQTGGMQDRNAAFAQAINAYKQQTEKQGPQAFSAAGVNPGMQAGMVGDGIPENAMRRANGTAVSYGEANGVKYVQGPNGRRIPIGNSGPAVAPQQNVNIGMVGRQGFDRNDPTGEANFQRTLASGGTARPSGEELQRRLLEDQRRQDEAGMDLPTMMRNRRAASLERQRGKDATAASAGELRNDYRMRQLEKMSLAGAAGARSVEEAKAQALGALRGVNQRGNKMEITPEMLVDHEMEKIMASPLAPKTQDEYEAIRARIAARRGIGGAKPPPAAPVVAPKPTGTAQNAKDELARILGIRGAPPAPPPSAPWKTDLPPQGTYSAWGNWQGR